ncbi:MAG: nucleotidyltransferase domain-containing protein [Ignavibacteriae bacterium]|nr:nucleotidyltransferase domain-containing protein [Ignavibacteriota bacterium]
MIEKTDILNFISENKDFFQEKFCLTKIGIFGSYANGTNTENSDIDLIVEFENNTEDLFHKKQDIKNIFKNKFNLEVDICREQFIKPVFRNLILNDAIYV